MPDTDQMRIPPSAGRCEHNQRESTSPMSAANPFARELYFSQVADESGRFFSIL